MTKASFYWHFENKGDLFSAMISVWESVFTAYMAQRISDRAVDPYEKLETLLHEIATRKFARYDIAMRAWAATDEAVAKAVNRVDKL